MTHAADPGDPVARIRRPATVDVRRVWVDEARDLTPWLATNLEFLDGLGLGPLAVSGTEVPLPDTSRALDILAETGDGRLVAIENQFGSIDHDHLTRGLAYAVGLDARALVVIAEGHRPEFVATAGYLNRAAESLSADEGAIGVFLVELSVEEIESLFVPRFVVVARPNEWLADIAPPSRNVRSIEEFVAKSEEDYREEIGVILRRWKQIPGTRLTYSQQAAALRLPKPATRGTVAVATLFLDGSTWLNRGYVDMAVEPAGGTIARFDEILSRQYQDVGRGGGDYYVSIREPDAARFARFAEEVASWFGELGSPS